MCKNCCFICHKEGCSTRNHSGYNCSHPTGSWHNNLLATFKAFMDNFFRDYHRGLVGNLHGQPMDPLLILENTWWTHLEGSATLPRTRNVPQTGEIYIFSWRSGVPQDDSRKRRNTDGPHQTQGHLRIVPTGKHHGHMILSWILQLLPEVHPFLLQYCLPPPGSHQIVKPLDLGTWPRESLLEPTDHIHQTTGPCLLQHL